MKSRGSRHVEEPSLDAIRRFQIMLDTDDESEYKVVSSTQQRLDLLLSSPDEVIDVSKPSRIKEEIREYPRATKIFTQRIEENGFCLALLLALFVLYYYIRKHGKRQRTAKVKTKPTNTETKARNICDSPSSDAQERRLHKAGSFEERTGERDTFVERRDQPVVRVSEVPLLRAEDSHSPQLDTFVMGESDIATIAAMPANAAVGSNAASRLPTVLLESNDASQADSVASKIQIFTSMARDIKLAEDILTANGMERSLAQQLAVSMKTSEVAMGSQRQLETQRMMMDTHQRHLDRQFSQRQHEESLHASKYDPNWNEKLEQKRDLCWSATTRIVWEVLVIHYLSRILKPVMDSFSSPQSHSPIQELGRLAIYAICDCGSSTNEIVSSQVTTALFSTPRAVAMLNYIGLDYLLTIDAGLCYGHCLLSFGGTVGLAAAIHQVLTMVAAPFLLHQIVNISGLALLFGGPNLWQSQHIIFAEALVSFPTLHGLGIGLLCIFAMVQWNYSSCKQRVQQACKSPTAFPESFTTSIQQLDTLYMQLRFFRYAMVAIFCATHFSSGS